MSKYQRFFEVDADKIFGRCKCPDDSGSCDWCRVYYFGVDDDQAIALDWLKKHYDTITICPYCGDGPKGESFGCCGESSAHFEEVYVDDDGEVIDIEDFIENFDPIKERVKFNMVVDANLARLGLMNLRLS